MDSGYRFRERDIREQREEMRLVLLDGNRVKVATVLDQGDDSMVVPLAATEVRELAAYYRRVNSGLDAAPDEEATGEQLAALRAKVLLDVCPFADFGVLRPYGNRLKRGLRFTSKVWVPEEGGTGTASSQGRRVSRSGGGAGACTGTP